MRRFFALSFLTLVSSCLPTPAPTAPAPVSFHSAKSAKEATQIAAIALVNAGFRVVQSDSLGQAVTASRTAAGNGNEDYVVCAYPRGSGAAANRETTLTVNLTAKPSTSGSDISVDGKVRTSYPGYEGTAMQIAPNETDCVSNGTMEQQLQTVLR